MNRYLSRYLCYYPATWLKGERIAPALRRARQFQEWSPARIRQFQLQRARDVAQWAQAHSPFYHQHYAGRDLSRIRSLAEFADLPAVSKTDLIEREADFITDLRGPFESKTTGGSTGHPVTVRKNSDALAFERAVTWRAYEWAGVKVGDPQGRFWGVPHSQRGRLRALVTDLVANRKRISAFDLNDDSLASYYERLRKFAPSYLYGYVSVIEALALFVRDRGLAPLPSVQSIITTSEVLYPQSRDLIEQVFRVKVFNEYGCGEVGSIAHECEYGRMHVMADNLLVEVEGGEEGELLVTDFHNLKTPLIRYRVGDFASLSAERCPCGRGLPVLEKIYGRAYDLLRLRNGDSIHPESLIYVLEDFRAEFDCLAQFQAVQESYDDIRLSVVPKANWSELMAERLRQRLKKSLSGDLNYRIETVDGIAREASGKMRLVKSSVELEVRAAASR